MTVTQLRVVLLKLKGVEEELTLAMVEYKQGMGGDPDAVGRMRLAIEELRAARVLIEMRHSVTLE